MFVRGSGRSNSPVRSAWDINARLAWLLDFDRLGGQSRRRRRGGVVVLTHVGVCLFDRNFCLLLENA